MLCNIAVMVNKHTMTMAACTYVFLKFHSILHHKNGPHTKYPNK